MLWYLGGEFAISTVLGALVGWYMERHPDKRKRHEERMDAIIEKMTKFAMKTRDPGSRWVP